MSPKPTDIDLLYGLEPVFEPGEQAGSDALEQFVNIACPYCAETIQVRLDLSAGSQTYIEDCQVCCQAIQLSQSVGETGDLEALDATRIDR